MATQAVKRCRRSAKSIVPHKNPTFFFIAPASQSTLSLSLVSISLTFSLRVDLDLLPAMEDDDDARSDSRSSSESQTDSQSPSHHSVSIAVTSGSGHHHHRPGDGALVDEPVTVVASPQQALAIALPVHQPRSSGKDVGGSGGREDCWSEGATSTLIDAWGERYLELSRGNLKQKHWQEVADAVTSRDSYTKPPKTDVQCKNRIDTLKKKYKNEKNKISASGASSWPFFTRLDLLLGPNHKHSSVPKPQSLPPPSQPNSHQKILAGVPIRTPSTQMRPQFPQRQRTSHPAFKKMRSSPPPPPTASSKSEDGASSADSSDGLPPLPSVAANGKRQQKKHQQPRQQGTQEQVDEGRMSGLRELTEAILRLGEVYEKVESSKMQQATEMEKQRMAFAKELEIQRMQFLMKTQVELSQLKSSSPSRGRSSWKKRRLGDVGGSSNHSNGNNNNNSSNSNN